MKKGSWRRFRKRNAGDEGVAEVAMEVGEISPLRRLTLALILLFILLVFLLALVFLARGSSVHGVVVEGLRGLPPATDEAGFERNMELHSGARFTTGNEVELLLNGHGTFPRMWDDIRSARKSITVQMYFFKHGEVADSLAANLSERARSGVRVLMLLDAYGALSLRRGWLDSLESAGVSIAHLRPLKWYKLDRLTHRSHVRLVIVDGIVGYTGGFGFSDEWLGNAELPDRWRETNVRMTGPVVPQLQAAFMAGWTEVTGELLTGEVYFPPPEESASGFKAALLHFAPTLGSPQAERFLALSLATARSTLYIANSYFVPDVQFRHMLADAVRRGVDVRVLTAGKQYTDLKVLVYAARARYEELLKAGVRIYEYRPTMMHAKTLVVDGRWSTVGSLNFDNRSLSYNDEANVVVLDPAFGAEMNAVFMKDLEQADEIKLSEFSKRSWTNRLSEILANLISEIL